ncbi:GNAT family N-acetyltransferase [Alkalihalophilus pseudofirmus]|uniref:GNAT family N-acetyltransferase n=1 Tax=Alkalihalophilus pseudofirmus TaxID=79885 RepID=A0AAJ2NQC1_ALKPS|nr:GNAT family N-acetyltransferase [Alkalihalophilus pseudofirmus]MDV2886669.1 GNAT family N-acetyltransferase [Alkalihalophilus pseudofirmus]
MLITFTRQFARKEAASFLARLNGLKEHHVGYCGESADEIAHTMEQEFSDLPLERCCIAAFEDGEMAGFLGLDIDLNENEAEIWGPFISVQDWEEVAYAMWEQLTAELPSLTYNGFYNQAHHYAHPFMTHIGAKKTGQHTILTVRKNEASLGDRSAAYQKPAKHHFASFKALHDKTFPNTYFSAEEMWETQSSTNQLLVAEEKGQTVGYIYVTASPSFKEGDIHFLAVDEAYRRKGIGAQLLKSGIRALFSYEEIEEITLCVNNNQKAALHSYLKAGFTEVHQLTAYKLKQ